MDDTLNRRLPETYGCGRTLTPHFKRLAARAVQFDNCFV